MRSKFITGCLSIGIATGIPSPAQDTAILREPDGNQPEFTLAGDSRSTRIETIWESELSNDDNNEMGHWLFACDGIIYAVVEPYGEQYDGILSIRRFDAASGQPITADDGSPLLTIPLPERLKRQNVANVPFVNSGFCVDDDGRPVIVTVCHGTSQASSRELAIYLSTIDFSNSTIETVWTDSRLFYPEIGPRDNSAKYIGNIGNVHGSLADGTLSFEFMLGSSYPKTDYFPHDHFIYYQSGDHRSFHLYDYPKRESQQPMHTFLGRVDSDSYVMSGLRDEIMLACFVGDDQNKKYHVAENLFDLADTHPDIVPRGDSGYIFTPIDHNGHRLWVAAKEITPENGISFNLMEWTAPTTFAGLTPLATLPSQPFAYGEKHYAPRYRLQACTIAATTAPDDNDGTGNNDGTSDNDPASTLTDITRTAGIGNDALSDTPADNDPGNAPGNSPDSGDNPGSDNGDGTDTVDTPAVTDLILYAPGTGIGRYRIVTDADDNSGDTSSLTHVTTATGRPYTINGRTLTINVDNQSATLATIHDLSGRRLLTIRTPQADLTALPAGLYLLTVTTPTPSSHKLILR